MNIEKLIRAAQEIEKPELVLKNGKILNVFTGEIVSGDVAVTDGYIVGIGQYSGQKEVELDGKYVVPGFVNAHLHVESSMVTPQVYSMEELKHGTTTIITDPHEIANVGGMTALYDIIKAAGASPVNYFIMLPSCVPSTPFEHSGAELSAEQLELFRNEPGVLGLGEMMNAVGVVGLDENVIAKIKAFSDMVIDGHAPMMSGKQLNAYACAGIATDHESITFDEALEKLRCGIAVLVRDGSASKNLEAVIKGVVEKNIDTSNLAFCTDDKHLGDIVKEGTIRYNIQQAIALGLPAVKAYQIATINAARIYGLKHIGAVACGYRADMVVLDDLEKVSVTQVYKDGVPLCEIPEPVQIQFRSELLNSVRYAPLPENAFEIPVRDEYSVIGLVKNQIVTKHIKMTHEEVMQGLRDGSVRKLAVIERHHETGYHSCAYVKGYGLKHGAVGTTVAHDSHNIIVLGDNDEDMFRAVEELKRINGGYTIVCGGKVVDSLPMPLGGLMSLSGAQEFIPRFDDFIELAYSMGVDKDIDPFITLSFIALPVIPELRLTDCGLFDVIRFSFTDKEQGGNT